MPRPWESLAPPPWVAAQPIYNRTIAVHRQKANATSTTVGGVGYGGREESTTSAEGETVLYTGIVAHIDLKRSGRTSHALLPSDSTDAPLWTIHVPAWALAQYSIRDRDIIVDDESYRYMVIAAFWTIAGYQVDTVRLEM